MGWQDFKFNRREFVFHSLKLAALGAIYPWSAKAMALVGGNTRLTSFGALSILQGATTENTTQFTIDLPVDTQVNYIAVDNTGKSYQPARVNPESRSHSKWRVDKVTFTNLSLSSAYQLQVRNSKDEVIDYRQFGMLDLQKANPRIAFLSCMKDSSFSIDDMWAGIEKHRPDLLFFLGDNCYGDANGSPGPELLWRRYIETRQRVPFYHFYQLIPVIATWDDHDFGLNNTEGHYPHKADSLKTFHSFFGQDGGLSTQLTKGPGNASVFSAFGHRFFLFDGRSFRDSSSGIMFGTEQLDWFFRHKNGGTGPMWLMMGSQFFGAYDKKESYEGKAPNEFNSLLTEIAQWESPATFVAGDKHFSEIMSIEPKILGYSAIEITSSSMHSTTRPFAKKNPRRRSIHHHKNFVMLDVVTESSGYSADVKVVGEKGKIKAQDAVQVKRAA